LPSSRPSATPLLAAAALAAALHGTPRATTQQPAGQAPSQPVFRAGVELVEVDAVALDASNRPVTDLRQEEFEVFEDGTPRPIVTFAAVNLPVPEPRPPRRLDVSSNGSADDGRVFFLVLDDVHTLRERSEAVKQVARRLIERLRPQDQVAALWVSLARDGARELTTNHAAVLDAIEAFAARQATVERRVRPTVVPLPDIEGGEAIRLMRPPDDLQKLFEGARPFNIVADVSNFLAAIPRRRKAMVYIGQGPARELLRDEGPLDAMEVEVIRAITAARRANVAFYAIDASGPLRLGEEGFEAGDGPLPLRDLARQRQRALAAFGEATGGFAAVNPDLAAVDRILTETSVYYLLGYYSEPPSRNAVLGFLRNVRASLWSGFRSIEVRTTRPGVRIRARKGYWPDDLRARKPSPPPRTADEEVYRTVSDLLPKSDLSLRAFAAAFRGAKAGPHPVAIMVEVAAPEFAALLPGQPFTDDVEVAVVAIEPGEKVRASHKVAARLGGGEAGAGSAVERYVVCTRLDLRPGRYQLRIGVRSAAAGRSGSVYREVDVPDFSNAPLSMSGVVIGRRGGAGPVPIAGRRALEALVPFTPSLDRELHAADRPEAFVTLHVAGRDDEAVLVTASLTDLTTGRISWTTTDRAAATPAGAPYRVSIPLDALPPGPYRLRIAAAGGGDTVRQELDLGVRR
jgi:VWFA-related protein